MARDEDVLAGADDQGWFGHQRDLGPAARSTSVHEIAGAGVSGRRLSNHQSRAQSYDRGFGERATPVRDRRRRFSSGEGESGAQRRAFDRGRV